MQSLEELIDNAVPHDIQLKKQLNIDAALGMYGNCCIYFTTIHATLHHLFILKF